MERTIKYYPYRYSYGGKHVEVIIKWTPQFLQSIEWEFGLEGEFTAYRVAQLFSNIISDNATRLKLWRMYKQGWFTRYCKEGIYFYTFSESARKYYRYWSAFNQEGSPLVKSYVRENGTTKNT